MCLLSLYTYKCKRYSIGPMFIIYIEALVTRFFSLPARPNSNFPNMKSALLVAIS